MKKVSIITPCYNSENFIGRYLDSILNQTYPSLELILIDDGSTDSTVEIINSYMDLFLQKGIEVKCISKTNGGAASAINVGLKEFTGDYLIWPDSDDFLTEDSIEKRVNFLERNSQYGLVRSDADIVNGNEPLKILGCISRKNRNRFNNDIFDELIKERTYCTPGCYMVRREVVLECIPKLHIYESRGGQNWQLLLPTTLKHKVGYIDESLYMYVVREDSHSHKPMKKGFNSIVKQINSHEDILLNTISRLEIDKIYYYSLIELKYKKIKLILADSYGKKDLCYKLYNNIKEYTIKYPKICKDNNIYLCNKTCTSKGNIPKTIVFGMGSYFEKLKKNIKDNYDIIAFADNDINKVGKIKDGVSIISPDKIPTLNYDKILITSMYFSPICKQLINNGINNDKIEVLFSNGKYSNIIVSKEGVVMYCFEDIMFDVEDVSRWLLP